MAERISKYPVGSRSYWKTIKMIKNNFTTSSLPPLLNGNIPITDPTEKACLFATHFAQNSTVSHNQNDDEIINPVPSKMKNIKFNKNTVAKYMQELKANKSTGLDGIPPQIFKRFSKQLSPILTKIFTLSYKTGVFPSCWKIAKVQPVHKKDSRSSPDNYRPIAAKIFGTIR